MDERKDLIEAIEKKLYQIQDIKFLRCIYEAVKVFANKSK